MMNLPHKEFLFISLTASPTLFVKYTSNGITFIPDSSNISPYFISIIFLL